MRSHVEIVKFREVGEYYDVQLAVDGVLATGLEVHKSARERYKSEDEFMAYLTQSSLTLIQLYGDARIPQQNLGG